MSWENSRKKKSKRENTHLEHFDQHGLFCRKRTSGGLLRVLKKKGENREKGGSMHLEHFDQHRLLSRKRTSGGLLRVLKRGEEKRGKRAK